MMPTSNRVAAWASRVWEAISAIVHIHELCHDDVEPGVEAVERRRRRTLVLRTSGAECRRFLSVPEGCVARRAVHDVSRRNVLRGCARSMTWAVDQKRAPGEVTAKRRGCSKSTGEMRAEYGCA